MGPTSQANQVAASVCVCGPASQGVGFPFKAVLPSFHFSSPLLHRSPTTTTPPPSSIASHEALLRDSATILISSWFLERTQLSSDCRSIAAIDKCFRCPHAVPQARFRSDKSHPSANPSRLSGLAESASTRKLTAPLSTSLGLCS